MERNVKTSLARSLSIRLSRESNPIIRPKTMSTPSIIDECIKNNQDVNL